MKIFFYIVLLAIFCFSCKSDDRIENPYLANINVNYTVNLNLPEFYNLNYQGNSYAIKTDGVGISGVVVYHIIGDLYTAFELSDPNHPINACSRLSLGTNKSIATCSCDDGNSYNLSTGQPLTGGGEYGLKQYSIIKRGNSLIITN